jgi:phage baseplate assembly protein gpV
MSNSQKTPFSISIQNLIQESIDDKLQGLGQAWPCTIVSVNGAIVTVEFNINNENLTPPQVTCTTIGSQYIRVPLKKGDAGVCVPANTRLGGVTGLGLGVAPLLNPSNLGGLIFLPVGNTNFPDVDPDAVVVTAPNGAYLETSDGLSSATISENQLLLQYGVNTILINASGITLTAPTSSIGITAAGITMVSAGATMTINSGGFNINGVLTINGHAYLAHTHGGVASGSSFTAGVTP